VYQNKTTVTVLVYILCSPFWCDRCYVDFDVHKFCEKKKIGIYPVLQMQVNTNWRDR